MTYRLVELELAAAGFDGDGNGLVRDGLLQRLLVVAGHALEAVDGHDVAAPLGDVALAVAGGVGVVLVSVDAAVADDEGERVVHHAAVAPAVLTVLGAVHQLLLRQRHQLAGHDLVDPFHRAHRRERPAATCSPCKRIAPSCKQCNAEIEKKKETYC